jgi:hypothetical protein
VVLIADRYVYMLHDLNALHLDPAAGKFAAVLFGHSHVPNFYTRKGVLYFNPGSCGPRRFRLPVTVGLLTVGEDGELRSAGLSSSIAIERAGVPPWPIPQELVPCAASSREGWESTFVILLGSAQCGLLLT